MDSVEISSVRPRRARSPATHLSLFGALAASSVQAGRPTPRLSRHFVRYREWRRDGSADPAVVIPSAFSLLTMPSWSTQPGAGQHAAAAELAVVRQRAVLVQPV